MRIKKIIVLSFLIVFVFVVMCFVYGYYFRLHSPFEVYKKDIPYTYRIGFTNLDQEVSIESISVQGKIPDWLSGTLFRNGPAKFTEGSSWVSNWFDGLAMLHSFSFYNGQVSYANKFLRSSDYLHVLKTGKMSYAGFAQDPCKSYFKKISSLFIPHQKKEQYIPNANVNIACFANYLVALTETPLPVKFDPKTLETLGVMHYNDGLPESNIHDTAHPHYDKKRKEHLGYFTQFGQKSTHNLFRIKDGSTKREIIASIEVQEPSYMHSFFITEKYAVLTLLPLVVNPLDLLLKKEAFIKNFKWKPELGTKLAVIDRINDKVVAIYTTSPFFAFHTVNAFEKKNTIVMDIIIYPDGRGIGKASFLKILSESPHDSFEGQKITVAEPDSDVLEAGQLTRLTLNLEKQTVELKKIFNEFIELPCINYEHYNMNPYVFVYAYGKKDSSCYSYVADKLLKINISNGIALEWFEEYCYPGEPIFVSAPLVQSEDDGVVLSVVLDVQKQLSFLLVLDAITFKEIARAYAPHHIPFGLHGLFISKLS